MKRKMKRKLRAIADHYKNEQVLKAVEELAELQETLIKGWNKRRMSLDQVTEEMADVRIMLDQLEYLFDNSGKIKTVYAEKVNRTIETIEKEGDSDMAGAQKHMKRSRRSHKDTGCINGFKRAAFKREAAAESKINVRSMIRSLTNRAKKLKSSEEGEE